MYDAIVVGARCGGSPVSMLLARMGYRVLLVDRATFPSDTISTQYIWPVGVAALKRWGLLDRLKATNCPPVHEIGIDLGPFKLKGTPPPIDGVVECYSPRRTVLDKLLLDAAGEAGATVQEAFTVTGVTSSDGRATGIRGHARNGPEIEESAKIVIGADGRHSVVAAAVGAEQYNARPVMTCCYYSYWRDVPPHVSTMRPRPGRVMVSTPTNDGLTLALVMFPISEFDAVKSDIDRQFMASVNLAPELSQLLQCGERVDRYYGTGDIPNFFRKPYGDGWALVGDAGYHKDPCTAQGISDAFQSAQWLADAIHAGFSGARPLGDAMADYQRTRDEHLMPAYEMACGLATLAPPPPEIQALYGALIHNQAETDRLIGTFAGTVPIPEFYSPENVGRIMSQAAAAGGS
jgi:flavin-dependent dehydrogenase